MNKNIYKIVIFTSNENYIYTVGKTENAHSTAQVEEIKRHMDHYVISFNDNTEAYVPADRAMIYTKN